MKIKILAVSTVLATVFFAFAAPVAKAVTVEELLAQIAALQAQIVALQAQLNQQIQPQQWCYTFNNYLIAGFTGKDVTMLQQALGKDGQTISDYSARNDGTFTEGTAAAVVKFQGKDGITQTGTVGPITRSKLNELYGCKSQPIACTMEAKLCPDGVTYVGRTGPNCEFAACPDTTKPSIAVTSPNGGEIWRIGETHNINWTSTINSGTAEVRLVDTNGRVFIILSNAPLMDGQNSLTWTVGKYYDANTAKYFDLTINPGQYKIQVISSTSKQDISDNYFTIASATDTGYYKTAYGACYDGSTVNYGGSTDCQSSSVWQSYVDIFCQNKCSAATGKCGVNSFSINNPCSGAGQQPSITVTSPDGGETWRVGETKTITWRTANVFSPNDKITLYVALASNLSMHCNIGQELPNTGSYNFTVRDPSTYCANAANNSLYRTGSQFKLLACVKSATSVDLCDVVRDYSDNAFTINEAAPTGSITITSPDSGQTFSQGATIGIAWVFSTPTQPMDVSIIDASGQSVGNFFQKVNPSNAYGQSIAFLTSSSSVDSTYIAPGQYKARVCISGTNDCAITDTYFTVVANTGPIVTLSVNGNKSVGYQNPTVNLGKVSQATITWSSVGADHCNTYGQTKLKLTDGTTWDKTNLPTSGYAIFNTPGQVDGLGNDMYTASIGVQCWNKDSSITDSKGIVVTWSTPPANCPVVNCVWDPCPGGHSADENGCVNCSTVCRPRL